MSPGMIFLTLVVVVCVVLTVYVIRNVWKRTHGRWTLVPHHPTPATIKDIRSFQGSQGTFMTWIYIHDLPLKSQRVMDVVRTEIPNRVAIHLAVDTREAGCVIRVERLGDKRDTKGQSIPVERVQRVLTPMPLQKWVHVGVVLNDRQVDVLVDGELRFAFTLDRPVELQGTATVHTEDALKPYVMTDRIQHMNRAMAVSEVRRVYYEGVSVDSKSLFRA